MSAALVAALAAALAGGFAPAARGATSSDLNRGVVDITSRLALEDGSSAGTGMLIASGVVLTNNHVIEGAGSIVVTDVTTSRRYRAGVVGYDLVDDVAVLRLRTAPRLGTVSLGDSSTVRVGDRVTAVGNAGGQGGTPTASTGKVTHLNRAITISEPSTGRSEHLTGLIQIDAALHAGDSGGPLFNSAGRVIGMNTAASVSFRFRGVPTSEGYAIPINTAMTVARRILGGSSSSRVHIGATARLGVQLGVQGPPGAPAVAGALVVGVADDTPAARAGITPGDTIVSLARHRVRSPTALSHVMLLHHPGDRVKVVWITQSGDREDATVRLATGPPA